jgi:type I restriction enzyme, S subunit
MRATLASLVEAIVDCEHKTAPAGNGFALSVGTRAMKDGRLIAGACKPVSRSTYEAWTKRMRPQPGDLILAREAPVGQVVRVPDSPPICLGQRTVLIRPDPSSVDPRFLHYWLLGPEAQQSMSALAAGATVPHLNVQDIRNLDVSALPIDRHLQVFAASTLSAIDDLIDNNRRRIEILEQMAQAIYREWFVRFRFPGHVDAPLVDSPLGRIPEDWTTPNVFAVADVGFGFPFKSPKFADAGPFPVVRIRDVPNGMTTTYTDEEVSERYRVTDGDVLVGMDGEFHIGQWTGGVAWLNQRVARLRPRRDLSAPHLMLAVAGPVRQWNDAIAGTTVAHLGKQHLEQIHILLPPKGLLRQASEAFDSIAREELSLVQAGRQLATLRDALLPRLVSGRIDVSGLDLDQAVGSVA